MFLIVHSILHPMSFFSALNVLPRLRRNFVKYVGKVTRVVHIETCLN